MCLHDWAPLQDPPCVTYKEVQRAGRKGCSVLNPQSAWAGNVPTALSLAELMSLTCSAFCGAETPPGWAVPPQGTAGSMAAAFSHPHLPKENNGEEMVSAAASQWEVKLLELNTWAS